MYAVEFTTKIKNDIVNIPKNYHNLYNQDVQVFIIPINKKTETFNPREFFGVASVSKQEIDNYLQYSRNDWDNYIDEK